MKKKRRWKEEGGDHLHLRGEGSLFVGCKCGLRGRKHLQRKKRYGKIVKELHAEGGTSSNLWRGPEEDVKAPNLIVHGERP